MLTIGAKKLLEERNRLGLTQNELAEKIGVGRTVITLVETDETYNLSVPTAKKLESVTGIAWNLFFERGE